MGHSVAEARIPEPALQAELRIPSGRCCFRGIMSDPALPPADAGRGRQPAMRKVFPMPERLVPLK